LQVCKSCFIVPRCIDFSKCHCTLLELVDYYMTKLHTFFLDLGCLWICCESSFTHFERVCFEPKLKVLVPWGCPPFYSNYMPKTSWWAFPLEGAQQPCWKGDKCIWLWNGGIHFWYEVPNARVPFALYFLYAWFFF
jgi:hypothetical protein